MSWPRFLNGLERQQRQQDEEAERVKRYGQVSDDELQKNRQEVEATLESLKADFPDWDTQSEAVGSEIRRLEKDRERIILTLAQRVKREPGPASVKDNSSLDGQTGTFTHSEDYRTVTLRGETHKLTSQQAQMIEILHRAHKDGNSDVSIAHILERLERTSSRWQDTFKSNSSAKIALIESGTRKGTLRLKV